MLFGDHTTACATEPPVGAACAPAPRARAWHAVWTRSHCEHLVAQQLVAKGYDPFLPEMAAWSRRGGRTRLIQVPMFPGYLFVPAALDKHQYVDILKARGVVRILGDAWDRLAAIPGPEITAIQRVVSASLPVLPHEHLTRGDRVTVVDGPLAGVEGLFVRGRSAKGRLVLSIQLLGRSVAVDVDCAAVVPCSIRKSA